MVFWISIQQIRYNLWAIGVLYLIFCICNNIIGVNRNNLLCEIGHKRVTVVSGKIIRSFTKSIEKIYSHGLFICKIYLSAGFQLFNIVQSKGAIFFKEKLNI